MDNSLYVALSSQVAIEQRLTTIAHNVANANTTGFRAGMVRFEEILTGVADSSKSFVSKGNSYVAQQGGALEQTGGSFDFAISGNAWFAVETAAGTVVTRDGRFHMNEVGELVTLDGNRVLDPGGSPIQLDPGGGVPVAQSDGLLMQNDVQVGAIGIYEYDPGANFRRHGSSGILAETPPVPVVDQVDVGVQQGYLEQSNVDPVSEMSKLIAVHRTFDNVAALIRDSESSMENAIRTLGSSS